MKHSERVLKSVHEYIDRTLYIYWTKKETQQGTCMYLKLVLLKLDIKCLRMHVGISFGILYTTFHPYSSRNYLHSILLRRSGTEIYHGYCKCIRGYVNLQYRWFAHTRLVMEPVCWQYKQCRPFPPEVAGLLLGNGLRPLTLIYRFSHRCSLCDMSGRNASQRKTSTLLAAIMWYRALSCLNVKL